ncbi:NAD(P)H-dependent oxidoreductase [Telmatospirillum sp.]|uniref:NAD(P)H-dependent oxidoreductase n=1 Tax=Telmatospirillum sp. TaxID=2079197 RepID=UPI00283C2D3A|nr:NAD(P)H-dependent oxidoreductase [Telmatospirillum sp.]MDR3440935.1 NAD(P)H-dependent oxidoreductase [Telmatospirillum sp.]
MKFSIILAHHRVGSFNHAIAETAKAVLVENGHCVNFHDLYQEGFNPVLPATEIRADSRLDPAVEVHCREIAEADGIVVVHPNWWGQPPAILKGWIDRVLRAGVAYKFNENDSGEGVPVGLLKAKRALIFNTTDTPSEREMAIFGDPLDTIWKNCILRYCGVETIVRKSYGVVVTSSLHERQKWLTDVATQIREMLIA